MSVPLRHEALNEELEWCGVKWNTNSAKQNHLWVMLSDAPLSTPLHAFWDELSNEAKAELFKIWLEVRS